MREVIKDKGRLEHILTAIGKIFQIYIVGKFFYIAYQL